MWSGVENYSKIVALLGKGFSVANAADKKRVPVWHVAASLCQAHIEPTLDSIHSAVRRKESAPTLSVGAFDKARRQAI